MRDCLLIYCSGNRLYLLEGSTEAAGACCSRSHSLPLCSCLVEKTTGFCKRPVSSTASQQRVEPHSELSLGSAARAPKPAGWHWASRSAQDSVERHSREREREGPREALRPASLAGGGSLEKHTTMAVTLSTDFMSRLDCTCTMQYTASGAACCREFLSPPELLPGMTEDNYAR